MIDFIKKYTVEGFVINITYGNDFIILFAHKGMQYQESVSLVNKPKASMKGAVICELTEANIIENLILLINRIKQKFNG